METLVATKDSGISAAVDDNRFYILGEFDESLKKDLIVPLTKKINDLSNQKKATIELYINSGGGLCYVMWHIVSLMELAKRRGITVRTIVVGEAFSAASMTAIAGTVGERYIDKTAEHLPHFGVVYGWPKQTPLQLERENEFHKRHFQHLVNHYKKYSNVPDLEKHIADDNFFITAKNSIKWGLADKYLEELE
jgi:ATP-dependent protease ClpP protease subunit